MAAGGRNINTQKESCERESAMWSIELVRPSRHEATILWEPIPCCDNMMITLHNLSKSTETVIHASPKKGSFNLPMKLITGDKYSVKVCAQLVESLNGIAIYRALHQATVTFSAVFTKLELSQLLNRAISFTIEKPNIFLHTKWFYRNKSHEYFGNILMTNGIMKCYLKDNNGDSASIINGKLFGLFFGVNVEKRSLYPPLISNYGPRRFHVPAGCFMIPDSTRLYFADFYCIKEAHYVTLVMTTQGSPADRFCGEELVGINPYNNCFLYKQLTARGGHVFVTSNVWVEVFYTEDMDLNWWINTQGCFMDNVESKGTSRPGGLPKNTACTICNLPP